MSLPRVIEVAARSERGCAHTRRWYDQRRGSARQLNWKEGAEQTLDKLRNGDLRGKDIIHL